MGENIKLKRVGKDQTRVMSLRGYNLLSERDRKKWEVVDGEIEETAKKKTVHVAGAGVKEVVSKGIEKDEPSFPTIKQIPAEKPFENLPVETPSQEPESNGATDEVFTALQTEYKDLTGKEPKGNWKAKRLSEEIQKVKDGSHEAE